MQTIELLAPAGNEAALRAAVRAGADAVYLGLDAFNARRGADNFTTESLGAACDYAHLRGVKVYVTLNTAVLPEEVSAALEMARQAWRAGADAFIVQDVGIAAELVRTLPEARLHVSTQMNTHNLAGIRAAARLGAKRVTLAREVSLEEMAALSAEAAELGMEVEAFAHGALCVCYSGQCLMSSLIGGRSANRGTCAQACRLPYELRNAALRKALPAPGEHLLSPRDLCAVDVLPALAEAGVSSFKIEGRMKSPEYVKAVVGVYRAVLDRYMAGDADAHATVAERATLEEAFSRGFTTAYLEGKRGNDIMSYQRPNNRGVFVGRVEEAKAGWVTVSSSERLREGDVLEFWTGKGHVAQAIGALESAGRKKTRIALDAKTRGVRTGDRVFRVRSAEAAYVDDEREPRVPLTGVARITLGQPLRVEFRVVDADGLSGVDARVAARLAAAGLADACGAAEGSVVEAARTKALAADDARAHIDRLGSTPFRVESLEVQLDEGVGLGFSQLHQVRAAALDALAAQLLAPYADRTLARVKPRAAHAPVRERGCHVAAWATNPVCARNARRAGAESLYVPALNYKRGESTIAGQRNEAVEQAGYPKQCAIALPVADHELVLPAREAARGFFDPWEYAEGRTVLVESLGAMQRAHELGLTFEVGPHLPLVNELALEQAAAYGAQRVWLSPELTLAQIAELGKVASVPLGLTVIGAQELMVTEHCLLMSQGPCNEDCDACARRKSPHFLKDRKGFEFPVVTDLLGRSHLYNSVPLDIVPSIPDLVAAGVSAFMVDTTLMNGEEAAQAVGRVARAVKVAQADGNALAKMPETTSGHLYRGVS